MSVSGGTRHQRPINYGGTVYCAGRRLDSTTKEEGDIASTSGGKKDGLNSPCAIIFVFRWEPQVRGAFCFSGRGRTGTNCKEKIATRARAKGRADWANKAIRRPWWTAAGRPTETHDRRAHYHESTAVIFFFFSWFRFVRASKYILYYVSLILCAPDIMLSLVLASGIPFMGNDPRE